ncbi:hypothetical protein Bca101_009835 [Brassica carinata]
MKDGYCVHGPEDRVTGTLDEDAWLRDRTRMDLESLETIAILDAQRDYMDMNEEDDLNEKNAMREGETEVQEPDQSDTQAAETTQATKPHNKKMEKGSRWFEIKGRG